MNERAAPAREHRLVVPADDEGARLDAWLAGHLELSRTRIARLVAEERVLLNGSVPRKAEPVQAGDEVVVRVPAPAPTALEPEDLPLEIVREDEHLLVVNKAAGMVVHPAPGHRTGTLVHALLHHVRDLSGIGGELRPGIVHRLDRDTSGLLVVAKSDEAHQGLADLLRRRKMRRLYLAVAWGHLDAPMLRVDEPIGRHPSDRTRMAVIQGGRRAVTHLRVRERWSGAELLDAGLETGRTHQIRVHLHHLGHPVVGDQTYGPGWERGIAGPNRHWAAGLARRAPRQLLHARLLAFTHPITGESIRLEAPLPDDFRTAVDWARGDLDGARRVGNDEGST